MSHEDPWEPWEEVAVRQFLAEGLTMAQIGVRLARSKSSVAGKMRRMGLSSPERNPVAASNATGRRWTAEELDVLRDGMWRGRTLRELAIQIDRSLASVGAKAVGLGINRGRTRRVHDSLRDLISAAAESAAPRAPGLPASAPTRPPVTAAPPRPAFRLLRPSGECAWPTERRPGHRAAYVFCGATCHVTGAGRRWPYCEVHGRLAYGLAPRKQPEEAPP